MLLREAILAFGVCFAVLHKVFGGIIQWTFIKVQTFYKHCGIIAEERKFVEMIRKNKFNPVGAFFCANDSRWPFSSLNLI